MTIFHPPLPPLDLPTAPLSVDQYHRMIDKGILKEGAAIELLDGRLIRKDRSAAGEDPMSVGNEHTLVVMRLTKIGRAFEKHGCHLRAQQPIAIKPFDEPEPDSAIVVGTEEDYAHRKPTPEDVLTVVEVADASLRRDRTSKLAIYARAGIPIYVIINLRDRSVEVHTQPLVASGGYADVATLSPRQTLQLPTARKAIIKIPVKRLLP